MKQNSKLGFSLIEISVVVLIIGILVAAISTGTDMVKRSKIASAQNLTSNSSISAMKDLVLWFETSLPTSFVSGLGEGEFVTVWRNHSPYYSIGNASQSTEANQPVYVEHATNYIPAVRFIDADNFLTIDGANSLLTDSNLNIFVVEDRDDSDVDDIRNILSSNDDANDNGLDIYYDATDNIVVNVAGTSLTFDAPLGDSLHYVSLDDGGLVVNGETLIRDDLNYYLNKRLPEIGSMAAIDATAAVDRIPAGNITNLTIGSSALSYFGNISEILIFNRRLRKEELVDIFDYFQAKYKLQLD